MAARPFDLATLVERLRGAGLRTDTRQYLAAHELLLAYAAQGRLLENEPEALVSHLAPIFCGSPEEIAVFRTEVLVWLAVSPACPDPERKPVEPRRRYLVYLLLAIVLLGGVALTWWMWPEPPPVAAPATEPAPAPVEAPRVDSTYLVGPLVEIANESVPVAAEFKQPIDWPALAMGTLAAGGLTYLILWLVNRWRRHYVLRRMPVTDDSSRVDLTPPSPTFTDMVPAQLRRIAAGLRRNRALGSLELSVAATVDATVKVGGFAVPVFTPRIVAPEYLVLIDRRGEHDHGAQHFHRWISQLRGHAVGVECYEFDSDPRVCREYGRPRTHHLAALLARHHRATLFLCADTMTCLDPISTRPRDWLRAFNALTNRVLFTPAPPYRWAFPEQRVLDAGFIVLPASIAGLRAAADMEREWRQPMTQAARYARELPRLIANDDLRWLNRDSPPPDTVARLLRELHAYLGPQGYQWLCACAVYPQISWAITLTLLDAVSPRNSQLDMHRATDEILPAMTRLPWFRYGYMPDWLRRLLIAHLPGELDRSVREALERLVCGVLTPRDGSPTDATTPLELRTRDRALDVALAAPANSPLKDAVFLDFLAGAAIDPLELRISSLPGSGAPRKRGFLQRIRERWRAMHLRTPKQMRLCAALLVAAMVALALWETSKNLREPVSVQDSDVTYLLAMNGPAQATLHAAVAPNGQFMLLATDEAGASVVVWDLVRNVARRVIPLDGTVYDFAISPHSDRFAVLTTDGILRIATGDVITAQINVPLGVAQPGEITSQMRFNSDSSRLLLFTQQRMWLCDLSTLQVRQLNRAGVRDAAFNPENPNQVLVVTDSAISAFDTRVPAQLGEITVPVTPFAVSIRPEPLLVATGVKNLQNDALRVEIRDGVSRTPKRTFTMGPSSYGWAWSGDDHLVAARTTFGSYEVHDIVTDKMVSARALDQDLGGSNNVDVYTVQFTRSGSLPDSTTYRILKRQIQIVAREQPALAPADAPPSVVQQPVPDQTPPADPPAAQEQNSPAQESPNALTPQEQAILDGLQPEVAAVARRLRELAAQAGFNIVLIAGRGEPRPEELKARTDSSPSLHPTGRAFDVDVEYTRGSLPDVVAEQFSVLSQLGLSLGLTWGGSWAVPVRGHFELPASIPPNAPRSPSISSVDTGQSTPTQSAPAPSAETPNRLRKTTYIFPRDQGSNDEYVKPDGQAGISYGAYVRAADGTAYGDFDIYLQAAFRDEARSDPVRFIRLSGTSSSPNNRVPLTGQNVLSISEYQRGVRSKTLDVGNLHYTLTIENAVVNEGTDPTFEPGQLRIRVDVEYLLRPLAPAGLQVN